MAKRASVLRRRKSKSKMDVSSGIEGPSRRDSEGDMVFYVEEPRAGSCHPCEEGFFIFYFIHLFFFYNVKKEHRKACRQKLKEIRKVWYSGKK